MRKKMVAGNWKMNKTPSEAIELVKELKPLVADSDVDVVFCVPSIDIMPVKNELEGSNIYIGAENMFYEEKGAYTGELSADMLTDAGVTHVILGHSERRQYFNEDDSMINRKVSAAIGHGIVPIICCGESFEQRERGITLQVIKKQIVGAFMRISAEDAAKCIIAYEPIWAIGTGRVATTQQAQEVCNVIRNNIRDIYGKQVAETVRILYGGSVNADNALALFSEPDIDGGLVGGASLRPEFAKIVNYNK
jgi:triosephosphate isomerase